MKYYLQLSQSSEYATCWTTWVRFPAGQARSGAYYTSFPMGSGGYFPLSTAAGAW